MALSVTMNPQTNHPIGSSRSLSLDLLRSAAIVMVLFTHIYDPSDIPIWGLERLFSGLKKGGWLGVDLFFVLSGFLIAGLLFNEFQRYGSISIKRFYLRRGLKIYPAYYVFFIACYFGATCIDGKTLCLSHIGSEVLFLQGYVRGFISHSWSLAVEEHFYLALPMILFILLHCNRRRADPFRLFPMIFGVVAIGCLALRCVAAVRHPPHFYTHVAPSHLRIDSLLFGVLLSYGYHFHRAWIMNWARRYRWVLIALGLLLFSPGYLVGKLTTTWMYTLGFTGFYLGAGALLLGTMSLNIRRGRITGGLAFIGKHSYSIYLWHIPVRAWGVGALEYGLGMALPPLARLAVYLIASLVVGVALSMLIEVPVLRLRDRLVPSRGRALSAESNSTCSIQATPIEQPYRRSAA